ncbi:cytochrome ubiquinol oxidase subunit I, partial [Rhizobium leguminosarum]|uniref:cytochrome ubiquinol oxidase subunit I n=1 Tax=Rhizobium ruizarguesonis TaxID=2081791 RepID=UPI0013BDAAA9
TTWILASNSWMHTPQGYAILDGRVVPTDWLAVIFNPSFPYRLVHMTLAAYLTTALIVCSAGAWHILRRHSTPSVRTMFSMGLWLLVFVAPIQILVGDAHGFNTLEYQPAKIAAIEGHWENDPNQTCLPL